PYSVLWVVLLCFPFLLTIFSVTGRIGTETRHGLYDIVRENYGHRWALVGAVLTILPNLAVIIADLMAVSDGLSILLRQDREFFIAAVAFSIWYILIFRDYKKITRALVLLSLPLYIYVAAAVITAPGITHLLRSAFIPKVTLSGDYI